MKIVSIFSFRSILLFCLLTCAFPVSLQAAPLRLPQEITGVDPKVTEYENSLSVLETNIAEATRLGTGGFLSAAATPTAALAAIALARADLVVFRNAAAGDAKDAAEAKLKDDIKNATTEVLAYVQALKRTLPAPLIRQTETQGSSGSARSAPKQKPIKLAGVVFKAGKFTIKWNAGVGPYSIMIKTLNTHVSPPDAFDAYTDGSYYNALPSGTDPITGTLYNLDLPKNFRSGSTACFKIVDSASLESNEDCFEFPLMTKTVVSSFKSSKISSHDLTLTWGSLPGAVAYAIYRDGELIAITSSLSYKEPVLLPGTSYEYQIIPLESFDAPESLVTAVRYENKFNPFASLFSLAAAGAAPAAPSGVRLIATTKPAPDVPKSGTIDMLAIFVNTGDQMTDYVPADVGKLETILNGDDNHKDSVFDYFQAVSFCPNKTCLTVRSIVWPTPLIVPGANIKKAQNSNTFNTKMLQQYLKENPGEQWRFDQGFYDLIDFVLPLDESIQIAGLGELGQTGAAVNSKQRLVWTNGIRDASVVSHEVGHTLGFDHADGLQCPTGQSPIADCTKKEYSEYSDVMGNGIGGTYVQFDSWRKWQAGWIDGNVVVPGKSDIYKIGAPELPDSNALIIKSSPALLVYFEVRLWNDPSVPFTSVNSYGGFGGLHVKYVFPQDVKNPKDPNSKDKSLQSYQLQYAYGSGYQPYIMKDGEAFELQQQDRGTRKWRLIQLKHTDRNATVFVRDPVDISYNIHPANDPSGNGAIRVGWDEVAKIPGDGVETSGGFDVYRDCPTFGCTEANLVSAGQTDHFYIDSKVISENPKIPHTYSVQAFDRFPNTRGLDGNPKKYLMPMSPSTYPFTAATPKKPAAPATSPVGGTPFNPDGIPCGPKVAGCF